MKIRKGVEVKIKGTDYAGVVEWIGVYDGVATKADVAVPNIGTLTLPIELLELPPRDEPESGIVMTEGETYHLKTSMGWYQLVFTEGGGWGRISPRTWKELNDYGKVTVLVPEEE